MISLSVTVTGRIYSGHRCKHTYPVGRFATEAEMVGRVKDLRGDAMALLRIAGDFAVLTGARFEAQRTAYERRGSRTVETVETWPVMTGRRRRAA